MQQRMGKDEKHDAKLFHIEEEQLYGSLIMSSLHIPPPFMFAMTTRINSSGSGTFSLLARVGNQNSLSQFQCVPFKLLLTRGRLFAPERLQTVVPESIAHLKKTFREERAGRNGNMIGIV